MPLRLALATALAVLACAASATASGLDVIRDCTFDEVMKKTYTQKEYRDALKRLSGDSDQYNNCRDVIKRAQAAALAGGTAKGKSGGGDSQGGGTAGPGAIGSRPAAEQLSSATDGERQAVELARTERSSPVSLDNAVDPAKVGTAPGVSQASDLPTPLLLLVALLLAGAVAIGGLRIRRLVDARRA